MVDPGAVGAAAQGAGNNSASLLRDVTAAYRRRRVRLHGQSGSVPVLESQVSFQFGLDQVQFDLGFVQGSLRRQLFGRQLV